MGSGRSAGAAVDACVNYLGTQRSKPDLGTCRLDFISGTEEMLGLIESWNSHEEGLGSPPSSAISCCKDDVSKDPA